MYQITEYKLKQLIKQEKTIRVDYECLQIMHQIVNTNHSTINSSFFEKMFNTVGSQLQHLILFEQLNYKIWQNDKLVNKLKQKTSFFIIIFDWIVKFQMRVGKLDQYQSQFQFIIEFLKNKAKTTFLRLVLLQDIYGNLKELIPDIYDEQILIISKDRPPQLKHETLTIEQALTIISFLKQVIIYEVIVKYETKKLYLNIISKAVGEVKQFNDFVSKSIYLLLSCCQTFDSDIQTEMTKLILIFLHRKLHTDTIVNFIKALMVKTSKSTRFGLLAEYSQLYKYFEFLNNKIVLQS